MKKLFKIIGVAALLATASIITSHAQDNSRVYQPVGFTIPAILANGTTNFYITGFTNAPYIYCGKCQNIGISTVMTAGTSGATNIYYFAPSVDGLFYDTNVAKSITYTNADTGANGTTNASVSSVNTGGYGYLKCWQIVSTINSGNETNISSTYSQKLSAP